jgi:uncharacterized oligopeptide transporter (OPT) family protein
MSERKPEKSALTEQLKHPSIFEPITLIVSMAVTALSAVVCMTIMARIGIVPNTSIIGALVAIAVGRTFAKQFRSLDRQNLVQTMCSAGGFGAGNAIFVPIVMVLLMGRSDLLFPMLVGATAGALIDVQIVGKIFDSPAYPASYPWPPGVATAEALIAGDEGGRKGRQLLEGVIAGIVGTYFKIPMAGVGIAFLANQYAMLALGVGLVLRGYSETLLGFNLGSTYIPQGIMIGASLVQLWQAYQMLMGSNEKNKQKAVVSEEQTTVEKSQALKGLRDGFILFLIGAVLITVLGGLWAGMSFGKLILFVLYSTFAAWASTIICGMCAMNSGWFPSTSIVVIFLAFAIFLGFPPIALAVFGGYTAATGPVYADMGYDLKSGWIIRKRNNSSREYELEGRKQQVYAELIGVVVAAVVVGLFGKMYFDQGMIPPFPKVFKAAIEAGAQPEILKTMLLWAIPGGILQFVGGPKRAMGILMGVGLLLSNPRYGLACLITVGVRMVIGEKFMQIRSPGLLAGDGLYGFFNALIRTYF